MVKIKYDDKVVMRVEQGKRRNNLKGLFDSQIKILEDRNVPELIIAEFQDKKSFVLDKASRMTIGKGNIPFLPIIPSAYLGYYGLMSMVKIELKSGHTSIINPILIKDQIQTTTNGLYYIFDVEDGESTRNNSPESVIQTFEEQSRSPLIADEIVNLCIITDVLYRHYVYAIGSRFGNFDKVPAVYLDSSFGFPELSWLYIYHSGDHWGSPSCGSR